VPKYCIAIHKRWNLEPDQKGVSYARRRAAMFKRASWQRWSADSLNHRSSDKWRVATLVIQLAGKHRRFHLQELELKNWIGVFDHSNPTRKTMCLWNPVLGEWFCKASPLQCHTGKLTNVAVQFFGETHKIRSPEAMTRIMNLLIPDSWKNMRRASDPSWTVVARHAMMFTKRKCMRRK